MGIPRRRLSRVAAEELLDGSASRRRDGSPLAELLRAVAAVGNPHEIEGAQAVVEALREAHPAPVSAPALQAPPYRSGRSTRFVRPSAVAMKVVALALLLAGGGWVLAAGTGVLPNPLAPEKSPSSPGPGGGRPSSSPIHSAPPSQAWDGLCVALLKHRPAAREEFLDTPAMANLIIAAGGRANVEAFCVKLLGAATPGDHPTPHATGSHDPARGGYRKSNGPPTTPPS